MPKRGHWWLGQRPLVHKGFWHSWSAHGVGDRVMEFLAQLLADSKLAPADWHVYITGGFLLCIHAMHGKVCHGLGYVRLHVNIADCLSFPLNPSGKAPL